jgi:hypothetical protein
MFETKVDSGAQEEKKENEVSRTHPTIHQLQPPI